MSGFQSKEHRKKVSDGLRRSWVLRTEAGAKRGLRFHNDRLRGLLREARVWLGRLPAKKSQLAEIVDLNRRIEEVVRGGVGQTALNTPSRTIQG